MDKKRGNCAKLEVLRQPYYTKPCTTTIFDGRCYTCVYSFLSPSATNAYYYSYFPIFCKNIKVYLLESNTKQVKRYTKYLYLNNGLDVKINFNHYLYILIKDMYIYSSVNIISAHYDLSLPTQSETMSVGVLACK